MDFNLPNIQINNQNVKLASGDCCSDDLVLSQSLSELLPHPETEPQTENNNVHIWEYTAASSERFPIQSTENIPKFFPIGSLKKTQYQDSLKRRGKINSVKVPNRADKFLERNNKNPKGSHSNECFTAKKSQPALNFVNMERLFSCQVCGTSPITATTVHMCQRGHQVCGNCYQHDSLCGVCGELLEGRNQPVETALQKLRLLRPELFFQEFQMTFAPDDPGEGGQLKAVHQSSHKPVRCPHLACRSTVAYNGFVVHFKFEHSAVPIITTAPRCCHQLPLQESQLHVTSTRVIAVFKVSLRSGLRKFDRNQVICCLLSTPHRIGCVQSLAVWCSSTYDDDTTSPLTYTLKSLNPRKAIAYRGPVSSLHWTTDSILRDGHCLVVSPEMLENIPLQNESPNTLQIEFFVNS